MKIDNEEIKTPSSKETLKVFDEIYREFQFHENDID